MILSSVPESESEMSIISELFDWKSRGRLVPSKSPSEVCGLFATRYAGVDVKGRGWEDEEGVAMRKVSGDPEPAAVAWMSGGFVGDMKDAPSGE